MSMIVAVAATTAPAHAQVVVSPYLDNNVTGDVQSGRGGVGVSAGYYVRGLRGLGFEVDLERHGHFFNDEDVAALVPAEGVDLNTDATLVMGNVVMPWRLESRAGIWCPYASVGLGVIRAVFDANVFMQGADQDTYDTQQTNVSFNAGGGVMHALTRLVGFRVDVRYIHALVDESAGKGGYFKDYAYWRVSVGVTFGFPR